MTTIKEESDLLVERMKKTASRLAALSEALTQAAASASQEIENFPVGHIASALARLGFCVVHADQVNEAVGVIDSVLNAETDTDETARLETLRKRLQWNYEIAYTRHV